MSIVKTDRIFHCLIGIFSSASSSTELSITAPAQAGKWSAWALTVTRAGLRFSAPVTLEVFRPLTVDFHLPRSLKVGESAEVDIKIGNNVNSCVDVRFFLFILLTLKFTKIKTGYGAVGVERRRKIPKQQFAVRHRTFEAGTARCHVIGGENRGDQSGTD